jgi:hypothetical protein
LAALAALGGCETSQTAPSAAQAANRDCFRNLDVDEYSVIDERSIKAHINANREYILTLNHNVNELDWAHAIALRSRTSFICVGEPVGVELMVGNPPFPYPLESIERAPQQQAATGS